MICRAERWRVRRGQIYRARGVGDTCLHRHSVKGWRSYGDRQKAESSVGASGEWMGGVGLYGRPASLSPTGVRNQSEVAEAGDHKGPPRTAPPPSPLRMLMGFSSTECLWGWGIPAPRQGALSGGQIMACAVHRPRPLKPTSMSAVICESSSSRHCRGAI